MGKSAIFVIKALYYSAAAVVSRCEPAFYRTLRTIANLPNESYLFPDKAGEPYCGREFTLSGVHSSSCPSCLIFLSPPTHRVLITLSFSPASYECKDTGEASFHTERLAGSFLGNPRIMQLVTLSTHLPAISSSDCHANSIISSIE